MDDFKILVCEDLKKDIRDIKLYINALDKEMQGVNLIYKDVNFEEIYEEMNHDYDLLILDLVDQKTGYEGENVLKHNVGNIPTLIYTSTGDQVMFDLQEKQEEYPFILGKLVKLRTGENLQSFIKHYIFQKNLAGPLFSLYNENDLILINSLITIGESNFNEIIYQIGQKLNKNNFIIHRMTSGLSGAILFKIEIDGKFSVLKLSKETDKLKEEHKNAVELYHKFPNRLINHIDYEEFYSYDKQVLGILLKEVDNSQTLFQLLMTSSTSKNKIENFLKNLFIDEQGLQNHYQNNQQNLSDWTSIFNKISEQKIHLIKTAYDELKPILQKYYNLFDIEDFRRLAVIHNYNKLNKTELLDEKFKKRLILSHGDFHSKNILVQSGHHPVIIDTGSIKYQHWSLDLCRLVVNLIINGIDFSQIEYFELESIKRYIVIVNKVLNRESIELDGVNDNTIHAINWLIKNFSKIFESDFDQFEYQLGLMKEFLQVSYRIDTIPPNKRTFALIAAHKSMIAANNNL
jgi:hypothetical protein